MSRLGLYLSALEDAGLLPDSKGSPKFCLGGEGAARAKGRAGILSFVFSLKAVCTVSRLPS